MFPFNLPGPAFLGFYTILGLALSVLLWWYPRRVKSSSNVDHTRPFFNAPYSLAYLNLGANHCLSICAFNLIDRGLMTATETGYICSDAKFTKQVSQPLEHALIQYAAGTPKALFNANKNVLVKAALHSIKTQLVQQGLLHSNPVWLPIKLLCLSILAVAGITKIIVALNHGHTNIIFLVMIMSFFIIGVAIYAGPRVSTEGKETLSIMQGLLAQLHGRMSELKPGGFTQEATLAAALFGLSALPAEVFPYIHTILPPVPVSSRDDGRSSDSGSSSSSCSSCSSSSCSSGCGGCGS
ncbi:MAG TPA: TIGR04222 domain-containing membrane protein [Cellvibrionaceae bacterium]